MGGYGSGREGWLPIVEDGLRVDLRSLRRKGYLEERLYDPVRLEWSRGGDTFASIQCLVNTTDQDPWLRLVYAVTRSGERINVDERLELVRFQQPFGGHRWYVVCPQTGSRCQCLYCPPGAIHFRSRKAFRCRLQYRSQGLTPAFRMLERANKIAERVATLLPPEERCNTRAMFPVKPKWMRWRTYDRLFTMWDQLSVDGELLALNRWVE